MCFWAVAKAAGFCVSLPNMSQRNLFTWLAAGWTLLSLIGLVVACAVPLGRDLWLTIDNFLVFDLLILAIFTGFRINLPAKSNTQSTEIGQNTTPSVSATEPLFRTVVRLALVGPLLWSVLATVLPYVLGGMFAGFPPLHFDFEASGEKTVSDYLTTADGATLWIGRTLAQGILLSCGMGAFVWCTVAIRKWRQRRRVAA